MVYVFLKNVGFNVIGTVYGLTVKHTAHNGKDVGSIPTRLIFITN